MLCGWLVSKHQLTYSVVCLSVYPSDCLSVYSLCLQSMSTDCLPPYQVCLQSLSTVYVYRLSASLSSLSAVYLPTSVCWSIFWMLSARPLSVLSLSHSLFRSTFCLLSIHCLSTLHLSTICLFYSLYCPLSVGASAVKHWWLFMSRLFVLFRCCCFLISLEHAHTHKPAWTCPQPAARRWPGEWRRHALSCVSREG